MLPQMTGRQRYKANALIKRLCANYDGGNCLLLDDGELCMRSVYFLLSAMQILPQCGIARRAEAGSRDIDVGSETVCERCGVPIEKHSNRQKYCADCARIMYLKTRRNINEIRGRAWTIRPPKPLFQATFYMQRSGVKVFIPFPLFCVLIFHEGRFIIWLILKQEIRSKAR